MYLALYVEFGPNHQVGVGAGFFANIFMVTVRRESSHNTRTYAPTTLHSVSLDYQDCILGPHPKA